MRVHYINIEQPDNSSDAPARATIGGKPIMVEGQQWPMCRLCKAQMIFFVQLDLLKSFELPLRSRSHLLVFMCPQHNDLPTDMVDNNDHSLPENYWQKSYGHYALILNDPRRAEQIMAKEKFIAESRLTFTDSEEEISWDGRIECGTPGFKIGGVPVANPGNFYCACGAEMVFMCQVPQAYAFSRTPNAPIQPAAVAKDQYNLFLGKPTFIYACKNQCSPYAVHAIAEQKDELAESA